ncbi:hypothetical protein HK101_006116 [Irineochytrium annulatum]|nr:hypothetical protein HK101_006116 [Irineochytrium annulatum]
MAGSAMTDVILGTRRQPSGGIRTNRNASSNSRPFSSMDETRVNQSVKPAPKSANRANYHPQQVVEELSPVLGTRFSGKKKK